MCWHMIITLQVLTSRLEYNFYLFLFLIGTTPIATDFWSDLDKQGDEHASAIRLNLLLHCIYYLHTVSLFDCANVLRALSN